jgi:hypothetical protein
MPDKPNMGLLGIIPEEATEQLLSWLTSALQPKPLTKDPLWDAAIRHGMLLGTPQYMPYGNAWLGNKMPPAHAQFNEQMAPDANSLVQMMMQHLKRNEELKKLLMSNPEKYGR